MPTDTVWMTMQEIADMYNVFGCYVRKAVKAIFKDGILKEQGVRRHVRKNDRISYGTGRRSGPSASAPACQHPPRKRKPRM